MSYIVQERRAFALGPIDKPGMSANMQAKAPTFTGAFSPATSPREADSPHLRLPLARLLELVMILQSERFPNARRLAEIVRGQPAHDLPRPDDPGSGRPYRSCTFPSDRDINSGATACFSRHSLTSRRRLPSWSRATSGASPIRSVRCFRFARPSPRSSSPFRAAFESDLADGGELIAETAPVSETPKERRAIHQAILNALLRRQRLRLSYRDGGQGPVSTTNFGLYRLARLEGQWALVGHSSAHGCVRLYWLPWVERAEATGEAYSIPPRFQLQRFLAKQQPNRRDRATEVRLRFSARLAAVVRDMPECSGQKKRPAPDGTLELVLKVERFDEVVHWVLSFGDQVEVIGPKS